MCDGQCYKNFVANFIALPGVKEFWRYVKFWSS